MCITSKKKLKAQIAELEQIKQQVIEYNNELANELEKMKITYPFEIGQVVYDVQLRSSKGRFTKTKASREHSYINEVVVDKKNYFNLVDRYDNKDVFTSYDAAECFLQSVCVECCQY